MAVIDWYSRYVLDWSLSTTLDADFCIETVGGLLERGRCGIFNTDQGAQFTTPRFTNPLLEKGIQVSMDGRGRALDNIFIERLWRTVKYEHVYLYDIRTVQEARTGLGAFFERYNHKRITNHWVIVRRRRCILRGNFICRIGYFFRSISSILILVVFGLDNGEYLRVWKVLFLTIVERRDIWRNVE